MLHLGTMNYILVPVIKAERIQYAKTFILVKYVSNIRKRSKDLTASITWHRDLGLPH